MAGSISLSLTQRYDKTSHLPLNGGLLYFYQAGTTTPQNAYQDISLTIPWPNPITLDSGGNVPQLFFADGYIKFRLANAVGVTQIDADYTLVMGPTAGVGAAPSVDATTILATGDLKVKYGTGAVTGFVRANGRTIGSATSSATESANSDCQTLFEYLWTADANLAVSTGRGASANADWVANKNIALPDWRGRALAGLDDMGNSAAGRLSATYFGTTATVLGAAGGAESRTLTAAQIPSITSANTGSVALSVSSTPTNVVQGTPIATTVGSGGLTRDTLTNPATSSAVASTGTIAIGNAAVTSNNTSGSAHATASPAMLATIYIKK